MKNELTPRLFFYHYNKPQTQKANKGVEVKEEELPPIKMSFHWDDTCHIVDHVRIHVPTWDKHQKKQPRLIIQGKANYVEFIEENGVKTAHAYIKIGRLP